MENLDLTGLSQISMMKVQQYVETLRKEEETEEKKEKLSFSWKGTLSELKDDFTSVELQYKSLDWW